LNRSGPAPPPPRRRRRRQGQRKLQRQQQLLLLPLPLRQPNAYCYASGVGMRMFGAERRDAMTNDGRAALKKQIGSIYWPKVGDNGPFVHLRTASPEMHTHNPLGAPPITNTPGQTQLNPANCCHGGRWLVRPSGPDGPAKWSRPRLARPTGLIERQLRRMARQAIKSACWLADGPTS
jgi:hypothetical protein